MKKETPPVIPDLATLPTHISDKDADKIEILSERTGRLRAEIALATEALNNSAAELDRLMAAARTQYKLALTDNVNLATRLITRAPPAK